MRKTGCMSATRFLFVLKWKGKVNPMESSNEFLGTERIGKLMQKYAIPCIISLLVGALYNIVDQIFIANGRPTEPLRKAAACILVCGDLDSAFRFAKDYWIIDGAIAAQNICLAAQELGLGAVWLGTWPQMDRVEAQQKLFALPETIVPHSIIALGYPEADLTAPRKSRYEDDRVHFNQW